MISVWSNARRVVPYVDMPLQHIADDMLRTMARGMNGAATRALVRRIRSAIPGVSMRTNFIVGFPGETEAHVDELCSYLEEEPFEHLVVFDYEREPETPSARMRPAVPVRERRRRRARVLEHQQRLSAARLRERIGSRLEVMIDGPTGRPGESVPTQFAGRSAGSAYEVDGGVVVEGRNLAPGTLVPVRVVGAGAYDLYARAETADSALRVVS